MVKMSEQNAAAPWLTGVIFDGHFEVGHLIARGGMAEVYHAVDLWSNNPVAVKVLLPHLSADPTQQQKFFREGAALSKIKHPNVVGVIASGTEKVHGQQVMFLVLEYVHGCTLSQLLKVRPVLSVGELLSIMIPAVEGLSEVHAHRLIHRDIKPANILLEDEHQTIKLSDFGLTRRADQNATGQLMGTPSFVAPEILDVRASVGPASDIFSAGVMMYRMLTGRMPFAVTENDQQVLYHNTNTDIPSVTQLAPGISSDIAGVVSWSTRRNPADRPQDATELYRALQDCLNRSTADERAFRAPLVTDLPLTRMWEDVTEIADRSGMTRVYRNTPISAFGQADDLIDVEADTSAPLTAHEKAVRSAASAPVQVYAPTQIAGVGPMTKPQATQKASASATPESDRSGHETLYWDVAQDPNTTVAFSGLSPATEAANAPASAPSATSISASYTPRRAGQTQQAGDAFIPAHSAHQSPGIVTAKSQAERRSPAEPWRAAPQPVALLAFSAFLLLGLVGAGFIGWWLATLLF